MDFHESAAVGLLRPASGDGRDALQDLQNLRGQRAVFHVQNFLRLCARIRKALRRFGQQVRKRRVILYKYCVVADQQDGLSLT